MLNDITLTHRDKIIWVEHRHGKELAMCNMGEDDTNVVSYTPSLTMVELFEVLGMLMDYLPVARKNLEIKFKYLDG